MLDARANSYIPMIDRRPFKVMISFVTLVAFLFNTVSYDFAWADRTPSVLTSVGTDRAVSPVSPGTFKKLNVKTFSLPQSLGIVKDSWSSQSPQTIIYIQDAHCNYYAQHAIADIIEYLTREYGAAAINLEGGAKDYDLSIFTGIKDMESRQRVADYFVKEGLVNGAEYFALNNPDKASLWGIEDTKLYIDNLKVYRDSLKTKDDTDKLLKNLSYILTNLKMNIYSKQLLALDLKYNQYKAGNIEFKDYLNYLTANSKDRLVDIKSFPNIFLLNQTLKMESDLDFNKANNQRDQLIDKLQKKMSKNGMKELVEKTVAFKAEMISQEDFYRYLVDKAKQSDISIESFPELEKYIVYISSYAAVDKMKINDEVTALEAKIRATLFRNEKERELDKLSRDLAILKNIFNISLTRADYQYYKANEASFDMSNYIAFIGRAGLNLPYNGSSDLSDLTRLDGYREQISKFYEYSFKRDDAFLRNIKLKKTSIIITGGFHSENLADLFKKNNISYISIIPNFKSVEGYQCPYFPLLSGNRDNPVERNITALLASGMAVASPFTALNDVVKKEAGESYSINEIRLELEWVSAQMKGKQGIVVKHGDKVLGAIGEKDKPLISVADWNKMSEDERSAFKVAYVTQFIPSVQLPTPEKPLFVKGWLTKEELLQPEPRSGIGTIAKLIVVSATLFFANIVGSAVALAGEATRNDVISVVQNSAQQIATTSVTSGGTITAGVIMAMIAGAAIIYMLLPKTGKELVISYAWHKGKIDRQVIDEENRRLLDALANWNYRPTTKLLATKENPVVVKVYPDNTDIVVDISLYITGIPYMTKVSSPSNNAGTLADKLATVLQLQKIPVGKFMSIESKPNDLGLDFIIEEISPEMIRFSRKIPGGEPGRDLLSIDVNVHELNPYLSDNLQSALIKMMQPKVAAKSDGISREWLIERIKRLKTLPSVPQLKSHHLTSEEIKSLLIGIGENISSARDLQRLADIIGEIPETILNREAKLQVIADILLRSPANDTGVGRPIRDYQIYWAQLTAREWKEYQDTTGVKELQIGIMGVHEGTHFYYEYISAKAIGVKARFTGFEVVEERANVARKRFEDCSDVDILSQDIFKLNTNTEPWLHHFDSINYTMMLHEIFSDKAFKVNTPANITEGNEALKKMIAKTKEMLKPNAQMMIHDGMIPVSWDNEDIIEVQLGAEASEGFKKVIQESALPFSRGSDLSAYQNGPSKEGWQSFRMTKRDLIYFLGKIHHVVPGYYTNHKGTRGTLEKEMTESRYAQQDLLNILSELDMTIVGQIAHYLEPTRRNYWKANIGFPENIPLPSQKFRMLIRNGAPSVTVEAAAAKSVGQSAATEPKTFRAGELYGLFYPDSGEIVIDLKKARDTLRLYFSAHFGWTKKDIELLSDDKIKGLIHCHEIFHQLEALAGIKSNEEMANIFAVNAMDLTLDENEKMKLNGLIRQIKNSKIDERTKDLILKQFELEYSSPEFLLNLNSPNRLGVDILKISSGNISSVPPGAKAMAVPEEAITVNDVAQQTIVPSAIAATPVQIDYSVVVSAFGQAVAPVRASQITDIQNGDPNASVCVKAYDKLVEGMAPLFAGATIVYPFMGPDVEFAKYFPETIVPISDDAKDIGRGQAILKTAGVDTLNDAVYKRLIEAYEKKPNATNIEEYRGVSGPRVLVMKGFAENAEIYGGIALIRKIVNELKPGDKILVLDTRELNLLRRAALLPSGNFSYKSSPLVIWQDAKLFQIPDVVCLFERTNVVVRDTMQEFGYEPNPDVLKTIINQSAVAVLLPVALPAVKTGATKTSPALRASSGITAKAETRIESIIDENATPDNLEIIVSDLQKQFVEHGYPPGKANGTIQAFCTEMLQNVERAGNGSQAVSARVLFYEYPDRLEIVISNRGEADKAVIDEKLKISAEAAAKKLTAAGGTGEDGINGDIGINIPNSMAEALGGSVHYDFENGFIYAIMSIPKQGMSPADTASATAVKSVAKNVSDEALETLTSLIDYGITPDEINKANLTTPEQVENFARERNLADKVKELLNRWLAISHKLATTVTVYDEGDGRQHSVYVITIDGNTYTLEVGDKGTFTAVSAFSTAPAVSVEIARYSLEADKLTYEQATAANAVAGDIQGGTFDYIITPQPASDTLLTVAQKVGVDLEMARKYKNSETKAIGYRYSENLTEDQFKKSMEMAIDKAYAGMQQNPGKDPRAIIFAPEKSYGIVKGLLDEKGITQRFTVVRENVPANGQIHEAAHIDLGKGLLNYERRKEKFDNLEMGRLADLVKVVVAQEAWNGKDDKQIIESIVNGTTVIDVIAPANIDKDWRKMQGQYIKLRTSV